MPESGARSVRPSLLTTPRDQTRAVAENCMRGDPQKLVDRDDRSSVPYKLEVKAVYSCCGAGEGARKGNRDKRHSLVPCLVSVSHLLSCLSCLSLSRSGHLAAWQSRLRFLESVVFDRRFSIFLDLGLALRWG